MWMTFEKQLVKDLLGYAEELVDEGHTLEAVHELVRFRIVNDEYDRFETEEEKEDFAYNVQNLIDEQYA